MFYTLLPIGVFWIVSSFFYFGGYDSVENMQNHKNSVSVPKTLQRMLLLNIFQITTTLPIEMGYMDHVTVEGFRWWYFLGGILLLDTIEFFVHYGYHLFPWFYRHFHKTHHEMKFSWSYGALYNSIPEALLTGSLIGLCFFQIFGFTLEEFSYITSLGTIFTCIDHCAYFDNFYFLGRKEYHKKHHLYGAGNFQQPFFTFWDVICGTVIRDRIMENDNNDFILSRQIS